MLDKNNIYDIKTLPWELLLSEIPLKQEEKKKKTFSSLEIFTENCQGEPSSFSILHLADENKNQYTLNDL